MSNTEEQKSVEQQVEAVTSQLEETTISQQPSGPVTELTEEQEARFNLIRSVGEECIQEDELRVLIKNKKEQIICYDGFEPSGRIHIAQGVMKAINVNKLTKAGCKFIFLVADWFALMNNKMDGDLEKIQTVGKYMIEVWKSIGMDLNNVEFVWSSEIINKDPNTYWLNVLDIARNNNLARIKRCSQIMGRNEAEDLSAAQIFYPCMQCADIFYLKADICQLGMDQRKVNMLAREYSELKRKDKKTKSKFRFSPIILSHHMLPGLDGSTKMAKSNPLAAIFMEDSEADVNKKVKSAFCEPGNIEKNPPLEYIKHIILPMRGELLIEKDEKFGGNKTYTTYEEIEKDFAEQTLHPSELKPALSKAINAILAPVREHFKNDQNAKSLLEKVQKFKVTK
ncbi:tyrosyl-tRNA synthetase [Naegleria gruberi]|uniref:tyrosine--tRNA ligase n=1 Tax=Naegleria gruberi TaxID=5762 RepID=D2V750_NAEGR|nr:tyrosyl-tRNA synthetase [Naegleria gruberi]EFC47307.1 tyrosyl-tRNA synthetase [Naegleria gruberi]|eukprot:XP_002680051.1 tyrosyl-tRNA synthetase [Naegleria gruberi strain NEG-M]